VPGAKARTLRLELWGAARKASLLERVAKIPVEIVGPGGKAVHAGETNTTGGD
jgi:hypothetical protein